MEDDIDIDVGQDSTQQGLGATASSGQGDGTCQDGFVSRGGVEVDGGDGC